jgi:hypothetical protein
MNGFGTMKAELTIQDGKEADDGAFRSPAFIWGIYKAERA